MTTRNVSAYDRLLFHHNSAGAFHTHNRFAASLAAAIHSPATYRKANGDESGQDQSVAPRFWHKDLAYYDRPRRGVDLITHHCTEDSSGSQVNTMVYIQVGSGEGG